MSLLPCHPDDGFEFLCFVERYGPGKADTVVISRLFDRENRGGLVQIRAYAVWPRRIEPQAENKKSTASRTGWAPIGLYRD